MAIIVTGGAGFIGSNFVIDWLSQIGTYLGEDDVVRFKDVYNRIN